MVPKGMLCTLPTSASGLLALSARAAESFPRYSMKKAPRLRGAFFIESRKRRQDLGGGREAADGSCPRYVTAPTCCPETPLSGGFPRFRVRHVEPVLQIGLGGDPCPQSWPRDHVPDLPSASE